MKTETTIRIYNEQAKKFINLYENADMRSLQGILLQFLKPKSIVLDIGFGSGRDLAFLKENGFEIWGVDPAASFVKHAKTRFKEIPNNFEIGKLPNLTLPPYFPKKFDAILLIAVWMHIPLIEQEAAAKRVCELLKPKGIVILSYSIGLRKNDERFFEELSSVKIEQFFKKNGCCKRYSDFNKDSLGREKIEWITEVFQKC